MRRIALAIFSSIFLTGGWAQVQEPKPRAERARQTGLPVSEELVQLSGWMMVVCSVGLQIRPLRRLSALALASQLPVVTFAGHHFWDMEPGPERMQQRAHFFKNLSLLGGALYIAFAKEH